MEYKLIILIILAFVDFVLLICAILNIRKEIIFTHKCKETTNAKIIRYVQMNDAELRVGYYFPIVSFAVDGREYIRKNEIYSEQKIKKNVTVKYWEKNPKYFYVVELGQPHSKDVAVFLGCLFLLIMFIGFVLFFYSITNYNVIMESIVFMW